MWEKALVEGKEVVVMMDANLDFLKWTNDNLPAGDSTLRLKPLIELLFEKIFPHGVTQLVSVATRSWPGQEDAGLDHVYTNKPEKMSGVYAEFIGGSDRKFIQITRFAKTLQRNIRYVKKEHLNIFLRRILSRQYKTCHGGMYIPVMILRRQQLFLQINLQQSLTRWRPSELYK